MYAKRADLWPLTAGVQQYTIGPGGTFDTPRPVNIDNANIVLNTSNPPVRRPVAIVDSSRWSLIAVQQIPFAIPLALWYDGGFSPMGTATLNLWP